MYFRKIVLTATLNLFALQALADPPGAPGYGGSSTSSSSNRSGGSTTSSSSSNRSSNTGNNPGNNNAAGYNGGTSSSSSGNRSSGSTTSSSSSSNRSSNTGNNPGNNNAPGYNGGGSTTSSSSGNRSSNTGNNPGNNNAPGYNGGTSSSSSGNRSTGSTTSSNSNSNSNSSNRSSNTGNNPGNNNAPGYNGGGSSTTASSSARSLGQRIADRAVNSALGQVAATAARAVSGVATGAANVMRNALEPQYNAINAGLAAERAVRDAYARTTGLTDRALDSIERAEYRGRSNYYDANNVPVNSRAVPEGPVASLMADRARPNVRTPGWERTLARDVDRLYREENAQVTVPGQITEENARQILGPVWDQMNSTQRYGVMNSVTVVGADVAPGLAGYNTRATTYAPGGIVAVNNDPNTGDYNTNMLHESQHAGDQAAYANASRDAASLSGRDRAEAVEARDAAQVAGGNRSDGAYQVDPADVAAAQAEMGAGYYPGYYESYVENVATDVANPEALVDDPYHSLTTEMRAFMNESTNQADLVQGIMDSYNAQPDVVQGRVPAMTPAESRAIVDMYRESAALQQIETTLNEYTSRRLND